MSVLGTGLHGICKGLELAFQEVRKGVELGSVEGVEQELRAEPHHAGLCGALEDHQHHLS